MQHLRQYFCAIKVQTLNLGTKMFRSKHSYEKAVRKMLIKLTPGVNFTNILRATSSNESFAQSFFILTF
jgi:hypothetical protein